jgi:glycosyltransferase involved in cell wall biosynthesis
MHKEKVKFLPFYLPDLEPMTENEIICKQNSRSKLKLLFVGGQAQRKGIVSLILALQLLPRELLENIELNIVSSFSDGKVDIPKNLPILNHGELPYKKVQKLFKEAHVYVMPSYIETFGLSYIEGMAYGCVVIARNLQPQKDMLNYGECGQLVQPNKPAEIRDALIELYKSKEKCIELAVNGNRKFNKDYYWKNVGVLWKNAFMEALA